MMICMFNHHLFEYAEIYYSKIRRQNLNKNLHLLRNTEHNRTVISTLSTLDLIQQCIFVAFLLNGKDNKMLKYKVINILIDAKCLWSVTLQKVEVYCMRE